jgi:hypothetical protein
MQLMPKLLRGLLILALLGLAAPVALAQGPSGTWASGIACINLDGSQDAIITLYFYPEGSSAAATSFTDTILVGGSKNYFSTNISGLPSGFLGSATISSNVEIACNLNTQTTGDGSSGNPYRMSTIRGFTTGDQTMYAPQVMKTLAGVWNSYISVQNTTGSSVSITITYRDRFGNVISAATETATILANSNKVFYQGSNANLPGGFIGSATIQSANSLQLIVASAAFYNSASSPSTAQFQTYAAFSSGASKLFVPRAVRRFSGYNTGMSIQNIGPDISGTITAVFTFAGNTYTVTRTDLLSGVSWVIYLPDVPELNPVDSLPMNQRFGSAVITAPGGSEIVAIVNEDNRGNPSDNNGGAVPVERIGQGDTYNAVPEGPGITNSVFFPQVTKNAGGVFSGGFQVANTTATPTTCTLTYGTSGVVENSVALAGNGSIARYLPAVGGLPASYNSSVTVQCGQPVIGIANLSVNLGSGRVGDSSMQGNGVNR